MNEFDRHWSENYYEELPHQKKVVAKKFLEPLFYYCRSCKQNRIFILDAGCGDGVHIEVILNNSFLMPSTCLVTGVDISESAIRISQNRLVQNDKITVSFIHADIADLPFEDGQFDVAFSFGVLAYTDNPFSSFSELCRITRRGGLIGLWIQPKSRGLMGSLLSLTRKISQLVGSAGSKLVADCIVPFLGILPTRSKLSLKNATWAQCREVVMVNIYPKQLIFPEPIEVKNWFVNKNIEIINQDLENPITLWGVKK